MHNNYQKEILNNFSPEYLGYWQIHHQMIIKKPMMPNSIEFARTNRADQKLNLSLKAVSSFAPNFALFSFKCIRAKLLMSVLWLPYHHQSSYLQMIQMIRTAFTSLICPINIVFAKDCLLTLVKSRLALGSPGCRSFVRHHAENG